MDYYYDDEGYNNALEGYEEYVDDDQNAQYLDEEYADVVDDITFVNTLETCITPSVSQVGKEVLALLFWSLACRLLCIIVINTKRSQIWLQHLISMFCGFAILYFTVDHAFLIVLLLSLVAYIIMLALEYRHSRNMGFIVAIATITLHLLYEMLWNKPETWQRIRGIQMVATMKIVSLAFDLKQQQQRQSSPPPTLKENNANRVPALVPYLGYIFCPATCVLGPWISYKAYLNTMEIKRFKLRWLLWTFVNAVLAVLFVCCSNCLVPLLLPHRTWKWLHTYRDALSVRCSHYFICFMSQATISAAGIALDSKEYNSLLGFMITKPLSIEFPRSLAALVRVWNIPMHHWLKTYIFCATRSRTKSYLAAILFTYLVSSFLHGFYIRIYLVLLSLAFFAYIESITRAKLADIFDACITSTPCHKPCEYSYCSKHTFWNKNTFAVLIVNGFFSLLTIFHLAYLGVMMTDANEQEERWQVSLTKWSHLNYIGHLLSVIIYLFYYLV